MMLGSPSVSTQAERENASVPGSGTWLSICQVIAAACARARPSIRRAGGEAELRLKRKWSTKAVIPQVGS